MDPAIKAIISGVIGGILVSIFGFLLPRIRTRVGSETEGALKSLQKDSWTPEQRQALYERLAVIETKLTLIQTSHSEFLQQMKEAFIEVAHSPHTPDLDELLFKDKDSSEDLKTEEVKRVIRMLGEQAKKEPYPGRQVALLGLRAIYRSQLKMDEKQKQMGVQLDSLVDGQQKLIAGQSCEETWWEKFCSLFKRRPSRK